MVSIALLLLVPTIPICYCRLSISSHSDHYLANEIMARVLEIASGNSEEDYPQQISESTQLADRLCSLLYGHRIDRRTHCFRDG